MLKAIPRVLPRILALGLAVGLGLVTQPAAASAGEWTPIGPTGVGMVTAIAAGRTAMYAATCGGVYRSDDGGASWRETGPARACVVRLAVDPRPDADTLYAIVDTHFFVSPRPEPSFIGLSGLFVESTLWVSRDGGQSWTQTSVFSGHSVAVDLSQPETAYVANYDPAYAPLEVTHDSGATWSRVENAPDAIFAEIASDPRDGPTRSKRIWSKRISQHLFRGVMVRPRDPGHQRRSRLRLRWRRLRGGVRELLPQNDRRALELHRASRNHGDPHRRDSCLADAAGANPHRHLPRLDVEQRRRRDLLARVVRPRRLPPRGRRRFLREHRLRRERHRRLPQRRPRGDLDQLERGPELHVGAGAGRRPLRPLHRSGPARRAGSTTSPRPARESSARPTAANRGPASP